METAEIQASTLSAQLTEIPDAPDRLWVRGTPAPTGTKYLAVVGSRALTSYGMEACTKLIKGLAGYPVSIVSGLALGADSCAHRAALSAGLHTIAIPGSGLSDTVLSPRSNLGLAHDILDAGGLLVSEHPPEYLPHAYDFPSRNRIMAGMSDAVLMVEACDKSGTLITARLAGEYGKELLCIPHRIGDANAYGAELYIRNGATLVATSEHLLEALKLTPAEKQVRTHPSLQGNELLVHTVLVNPLERDAVVRITGLPTSDVITVLITLELKGLVREEFGLWRRVC